MRAAGLLGKALAEHGAAAAGDHAAHARIGVGKKKRLGGKPKRLGDEGVRVCHGAVMVARRHPEFFANRAGGAGILPALFRFQIIRV